MLNLLQSNTNLFFFYLVTKVTVNEKCSPSELCNDVAGLACQIGVCKCANGFYWKNDKCGILIWLVSTRFYMILISNLLQVQSNVFSQKCASNEECDGTKNLACKDGVCECKETTLFWNEKSANCGIFIHSFH